MRKRVMGPKEQNRTEKDRVLSAVAAFDRLISTVAVTERKLFISLCLCPSVTVELH